MRKLLLGAIALSFSGLLVGCDPLTQYSLSEQQINSYLQKHNDFQKQLGVPGLVDAHIRLANLSSQIGRTEPGKVTVSGDANIDLTSLFGPQKADITLILKAAPTFDKKQGAIYLKDMQVVDYAVKPEKMQSIIKGLMPYLGPSLKSYFNQRPAYVLSADHSKGEAIAKKLAKGLEVKPGQLLILFTD